MANPEHVEILKKGVDEWNKWRKDNPETFPDLKSENLNGADLRGANLEGANLQEATLFDANLKNATLVDANLVGAYLVQANFEEAYLGGATLKNATLVDANLEGAELIGVNLEGATLEKADLRAANLELATLYKANLRAANLELATLYTANLEGADLRGTNLEKAGLGGATLKNATLDRANLEGAELMSANLEGAELMSANLEGADFAYADLSNCKMYDVKYYINNWYWPFKKHRKTNFLYANAATMDASKNPNLKRYIEQEQFIDSFVNKSWANKWIVFPIWKVTCDCGRNLFAWLFWSILLAIGYGFIYERFNLLYWEVKDGIEITWNGFVPYYFSVVTFTTLGFGDVVARTSWGQLVVMTEVILGYIMLGGLISIFANKLIAKM